MTFVIKLHDPFCNTHFHIFNENGYEITYTPKLMPNLIFVKKENGTIEELEKLDIVKSARHERIGTIWV